MDELNKRIRVLSPAKRALLQQRLLKHKPQPETQVIPRRDPYRPAPLSFPQERLWFLDQLEPGAAVYNIPLGLRLKGALNLAVLQQCLDEIVGGHEALRTRFETVEDRPVQVIQPAA